MAERQLSVSRLLRSLRVMLPLVMATCTVLWVVDAKNARDMPWWVWTFLIPLGFVFALGPMTWLRFEGDRDIRTRRFWTALVLCFAWIFVALAIILVVMAALGV
jgi:hypothetical protein